MTQLITSELGSLTLAVAAYALGSLIYRKTGNNAIANPLLIATLLLGFGLRALGASTEQFSSSAAMINFWIMPATAVLGVAIWRNLPIIRKNLVPVLGGCIAGSFTAVACVLSMCKLFGLDEELTISLAPKSVTTAIATSIAQQYGGMVPITIFAVIVTGIFGAVAAPFLVRLVRVKDPVEAGLALGACSHAVGTSAAVKMGETEGAMSGVAMGLCGVFTVLFALALPAVLGLFW